MRGAAPSPYDAAVPSRTVSRAKENFMSPFTRRDVLRGAVAAGGAIAFSSAARSQPAGRMVELGARPDPVRIDTAKTAVLVVDMQNDFGSRGGMFDRAGIDISSIQRAVAPIARSLEVARRAGLPVIYLKMAYRPDLSDLGEVDSVNRARHMSFGVGRHVQAPDGAPSRILIRDTWNTDIVAGLEPHPEDLVIHKTRFSGFYGTDLHERLAGLGARHLIVTGCTTSICVESTVRDAMFRDYSCVLLEDCMNEPIGQGNHDATLRAVEQLLGWVSDSARFAAALSARGT
jgi:ureidoacrylate peracid hydrolase